MVVAQRAWQLIESGVEEHGNDHAKRLLQVIQPPEDDIVDLAMVREAINNETDKMSREKGVPEEVYDDPYSWLAKQAQVDKLVIDAAFDCYEGIDSRSFAMRMWGWIRIDANMAVTLYTIDKATCKRLDAGLFKICDDEGLKDYTEYSWSVESINPGGHATAISGGLLADHKTLRSKVVRHFVPGWPMQNGK